MAEGCGPPEPDDEWVVGMVMAWIGFAIALCLGEYWAAEILRATGALLLVGYALTEGGK